MSNNSPKDKNNPSLSDVPHRIPKEDDLNPESLKKDILSPYDSVREMDNDNIEKEEEDQT